MFLRDGALHEGFAASAKTDNNSRFFKLVLRAGEQLTPLIKALANHGGSLVNKI
jgi:hypothetical protein